MTNFTLGKKHDTYHDTRLSTTPWVNNIPEKWVMDPIRNLFTTRKIVVGNTSNNYKLLRLSINGVTPRLVDSAGKNPENYDTYQIFEHNDLVVCLFDYDVTPCTVGYVPERGMLTGAYTRLSPKKEVDSKYYYYSFRFLDQRKELLYLCTGLRSSLSKQVFWPMRIMRPDYHTQIGISSFLDKKTVLIDQIISKKQKLIDLLQEKRAAIITHAVTKGLDPSIITKDSNNPIVDRVQEGSTILPLKRILHAKITDGPHTTPKLVDDGVTFISAESIQSDNTIDFSKNRGNISRADHVEFCRKANPKLNDIFIVKSGATTGRTAIVLTENEFSIWSPLALLRPDFVKCIPKYLYYYLISDIFQNQIKVSWSFGTQQNIGMGVIENLDVILPSKDDQEKIANYLDKNSDATANKIKIIQKQIKLLREYRSSLIYHAVTGKIKV